MSKRDPKALDASAGDARGHGPVLSRRAALSLAGLGGMALLTLKEGVLSPKRAEAAGYYWSGGAHAKTAEMPDDYVPKTGGTYNDGLAAAAWDLKDGDLLAFDPSAVEMFRPTRAEFTPAAGSPFAIDDSETQYGHVGSVTSVEESIRWQFDASEQPLRAGTWYEVPGYTLTWPNGGTDQDGNRHDVTLTVSSVRFKPATDISSGKVTCDVMGWNQNESIWASSSTHLGDNFADDIMMDVQLDMTISFSGASAGDKFVYYMYDIDQPTESLKPGSGFGALHTSEDTLLSEDGGWIKSGGITDTYDERSGMTSLCDATGTSFTWDGIACGTTLLGQFSAFNRTKGRKEVKDLDVSKLRLAYYGASLAGTQFCVMNRTINANDYNHRSGDGPTQYNGGPYTAVDGTHFFGELWEIGDHWGYDVHMVDGQLGIGQWRFQSSQGGSPPDPSNPYSYVTEWNYRWVAPSKEGESGYWVRTSPRRWSEYYLADFNGSKTTNLSVHEAFVPGSQAEKHYIRPADIQLSPSMSAGLPTGINGYKDRAWSPSVVGVSAGPSEGYEWSFTGSNKNVPIIGSSARLHYMVFGADGAWHEVMYEGEGKSEPREGTDGNGLPIHFGCSSNGFTVNGIAQSLPAYDPAGFHPDYSMVPAMNGRVTGDGAWILNPNATAAAKGQRRGTATYLGDGGDGWMGWHFTGGTPQPPSDGVLDGWNRPDEDDAIQKPMPSGSNIFKKYGPSGFNKDGYGEVMNAENWQFCHVKGVKERGMGAGVRSPVTSVRLVEGDNYVWSVNHATISFDWLKPGPNGGERTALREHGVGAFSNEIDYTDFNGVCIWDNPDNGQYPGAQLYDLTIPNKLDVRVGYPVRLKEFLGSCFTPHNYGQDAEDTEDRWTRWRWQGWHLDTDEGKYTDAVTNLTPLANGDHTYYTGWMALDADGIVTERVVNV